MGSCVGRGLAPAAFLREGGKEIRFDDGKMYSPWRMDGVVLSTSAVLL